MYVNADAIREDKGTQISNLKDGIKCIKDKYYKVKSQSFDAYYVVEKTVPLQKIQKKYVNL